MRRAVRNFYRYGVLFVWPAVIIGYFCVRSDGQIEIAECSALGLGAIALILPAFGFLHRCSSGYEVVLQPPMAVRSSDSNNGPSLATTMGLTAFTVVIAAMVAMAGIVSLSDFFRR